MPKKQFFKTSSVYSVSRITEMLKGSELKQAGCYAWFFRLEAIKQLGGIVDNLPLEKCYVRGSLVLLYIGTSSSKGIKEGVEPRCLKSRLKKHLGKNASCSTLRLSLGLLLGQNLKKRRSRFRLEDEDDLNSWLCDNAFVCFVEDSDPIELESAILKHLIFYPLNIKDNPFTSCKSKDCPPISCGNFEEEKKWLQALSGLRKTKKQAINLT